MAALTGVVAHAVLAGSVLAGPVLLPISRFRWLVWARLGANIATDEVPMFCQNSSLISPKPLLSAELCLAAPRRPGLRSWPLTLSLCLTAGLLTNAILSSPAQAAPKKKDKKPAAQAPEDAAQPATPAPQAAQPAPAPPPPAPADTAPAKSKSKPTEPAPAAPQVEPPSAPAASGWSDPRHGDSPTAKVVPTHQGAGEAPHLRYGKSSNWEGFFLNLNVGYANTGGVDGPTIPEPDGASGLTSMRLSNPTAYAKAVTTNRGGGLAGAFQIGYNIKGYVSLWADLSWHGTWGSTIDNAGTGTVAAMIGLHPLRFWRPDLPVDLKLYAGYGIFDIMYYYENQFQVDAKGKAWTGTALPFGLSTEVRLSEDGVFTLGVDLRMVQASYNKWIYNNDKNIASTLTSAQTTSRNEGRLMLGWHF